MGVVLPGTSPSSPSLAREQARSPPPPPASAAQQGRGAERWGGRLPPHQRGAWLPTLGGGVRSEAAGYRRGRRVPPLLCALPQPSTRIATAGDNRGPQHPAPSLVRPTRPPERVSPPLPCSVLLPSTRTHCRSPEARRCCTSASTSPLSCRCPQVDLWHGCELESRQGSQPGPEIGTRGDRSCIRSEAPQPSAPFGTVSPGRGGARPRIGARIGVTPTLLGETGDFSRPIYKHPVPRGRCPYLLHPYGGGTPF